MSRVGLVLGGGGITGAAYHLGSLLAVEAATGWHPSKADVVVGTSCGAFAAALLRGDQLSIDTLIDGAHDRDEVTERLKQRVYRRSRPRGMVRWLRRGVLPGLTRPDLRLAVGSPGLYRTDGIADWLGERLGSLAESWPSQPTVVVAYDLENRRRMAFGTDEAPDVSLREAVGASCAVPFVYEPVRIDGRWYADGGMASGTSADLLLASEDPLDLVIVIAPMAATESRTGARFYEEAFDRFGRSALDQELARIREAWPATDVVVIRPDHSVLAVTRPNPLSTRAAVPAFLRTLRSLRSQLGDADTWAILSHHLATERVP